MLIQHKPVVNKYYRLVHVYRGNLHCVQNYSINQIYNNQPLFFHLKIINNK